jgi:LysR family glycine cleavage system transcriptional activator
MRSLPPLTSLRSFEAAGRHLSFTRAAAELRVTHGAVSRAIRTLEDYLQTPLFQRQTRAVVLTSAGSFYHLVVHDLLEKLAAATLQLTDHRTSGIVNISTLDSFAAKWLLPRLFRFSEAHRDTDVRLSTSTELADFITDGIDLAIRFGRGAYPGLAAELLLKEELTPVCSPELLAKGPPLTAPADLAHHMLIHDDFPIDWTTWLRAAGVTGVDARRGLRVENSMHAVQAAVAGHGIALGRSALVADDLAAGRLITPFTVTLPAGLAYYVVYPPEALARPRVKALRDWLLAEVARGESD